MAKGSSATSPVRWTRGPVECWRGWGQRLRGGGATRRRRGVLGNVIHLHRIGVGRRGGGGEEAVPQVRLQHFRVFFFSVA
jgi:hypothetical protein